MSERPGRDMPAWKRGVVAFAILSVIILVVVLVDALI